ncbi:hypothetical protein [Streptomyces sp. NPDC057287]
MLIQNRTPDMEEIMLPPDCQRILATVRPAAGVSNMSVRSSVPIAGARA